MKMSRKLFISLLLIAAMTTVPFCLAGDKKAKPRVQILGIGVSKSVPPKASVPFSIGRFSGTTIALALHYPNAYVLKLLDFKHNLRLSDDTGKVLANLVQKASMNDKNGWLCGPYRAYDNDATFLSCTLSNSKAPADKAKRFCLKGDIAALIGLKEKIEEQKNVELKKDNKITIGPAPFTILNCKQGEKGQYLYLTMATDKSCDAIKQISFTDPAGKEIKALKIGGESRIGNGEIYLEFKYQMETKAKKINVKILYCQETRKVKIPVDKTFSIGL